MTTTSLYQTYRPNDWDQVIGQDEIIQTLKNQLDQDSISHGYLFYGSRGLGKTTTARILAEKLGIQSEDLYEIDAASNRGIDDIREIRDGVKVRPFRSPYKMYLIDEVHMLTKEAFNALLKTLEEPPAYIIFVLATTELHKVPDTIKSRVQVYTFKQPNLETLADFITRTAVAEKVDVKPEIALQLARLADGSYRDALGQLQKYIANPNSLESSTSLQASVEGYVSWLDEIKNGSNKAVVSAITNTIITTQTPKVFYNQLVLVVTDNAAAELQQGSDGYFWQQALKVMLQYRDSASSDNATVARAGLIVITGKLVSPNE
jgi:DNA polymerase III subunit gamma/tau